MTPLAYRIRIRLLRLRGALLQRPRLGALGAGSFIERPGLLLGHRNIRIGSRTSIRWGARIEAQPRFAHRTPTLRIGDDTNIEQNVHIMCQSLVEIGDRVSITPNCVIVDVTHPFDHVEGKVGDGILDEDSYVRIEDDVFLGAGCVVMPNVTIGRGTVVGAGSVVATSLPAGVVAAGSPARVIRRRLAAAGAGE